MKLRNWLEYMQLAPDEGGGDAGLSDAEATLEAMVGGSDVSEAAVMGRDDSESPVLTDAVDEDQVLTAAEEAWERHFGEDERDLSDSAFDDDKPAKAEQSDDEDEEEDEGQAEESQDEDGEVEQEAPEPTEQSADDPPPAGFSSWRQTAEALYHELSRVQAQQAPAPQSAGTVPAGPQPGAIPHAGNELVEEAAQRLLDGDEQWIKAQPQTIQQQALEQAQALTRRHKQFVRDPEAFLSKYASSVTRQLEERLARQEQVLATLYSERILGSAPQIRDDPRAMADVREFMSMGMPYDKAFQFAQERQQLRELQASKQKVDSKARDQRAQRDAQRGAQGSTRKRRRGRKGKGKKAQITASASDPMTMARQIQRALDRGERLD